MHTPRILLVDDDLALLEALPHMVALRIHGVVVDTSDTVLGAIEQIQARDYDAIVSDIKMPGMDGFEVLEWIRRQWEFFELCVVMLTNSDHIRDANEAYRLGANSFLVKPLDFQNARELGRSLETLLAKGFQGGTRGR